MFAGNKIWYGVILFRVVQAILICTSFSPDEYWQSLEVAYHIVFSRQFQGSTSGSGGGSSSQVNTIRDRLTWEWRVALRGYTHPLIFAAFYKMLDVLHLATPILMIQGPKIIQGLCCAAGDWFTYTAARKWHSGALGQMALLMSLMNWFNFYCGARTFSNSMEFVLTIAALSYLPSWDLALLRQEPKLPELLLAKKPQKSSSTAAKSTPQRTPFLPSLCGFFFFAGLGTVIRPTNAVVWIPCVLDLLWCFPRKWLRIVMVGGSFAVAWFTLSVLVDSYFYHQLMAAPNQPFKLVLCLWNFLTFNALEGKSALFGVHPWHWYFLQGLPMIAGTQLIFAFVGCIELMRQKVLSDDSTTSPKGLPLSLKPLCVTWYVISMYSYFRHKEFRFIYPILPLVLIYAAYGWLYLQQWSCQRRNSSCCKRLINLVWYFVLASNLGTASYFGFIHQRGTISVTGYLRSLPKAEVSLTGNRNVDFLMGCHQTPGLAYFHNSNLTLKWMDCSVEFDGHGNRLATEHLQFLTYPTQWVQTSYEGKDAAAVNSVVSLAKPRPLPYRFVMYDTMAEELSPFLRQHSYELDTKIFHTLTPWAEEFTSNFIHVYKQKQK